MSENDLHSMAAIINLSISIQIRACLKIGCKTAKLLALPAYYQWTLFNVLIKNVKVNLSIKDL